MFYVPKISNLFMCFMCPKLVLYLHYVPSSTFYTVSPLVCLPVVDEILHTRHKQGSRAGLGCQVGGYVVDSLAFPEFYHIKSLKYTSVFIISRELYFSFYHIKSLKYTSVSIISRELYFSFYHIKSLKYTSVFIMSRA